MRRFHISVAAFTLFSFLKVLNVEKITHVHLTDRAAINMMVLLFFFFSFPFLMSPQTNITKETPGNKKPVLCILTPQINIYILNI